MQKDGERFASDPMLSSSEVQKFLREHPHVNWEDSLLYVLDTYPQQVNGKVQWLLEGGAAVRLYNRRRRVPRDIDIITRNAEMENDFANSSRFDIKTVQKWFNLRHLTFTKEKEEVLFSNPVTKKLHGKKILTLNRTVLVISKLINTARYLPQREEDIDDIELLRANKNEVAKLMKQISDE